MKNIKIGLILAILVLVSSGCATTYIVVTKGDRFLTLGQYEEAIKTFTEDIRHSPRNAYSYSHRGWAYFYTKHYKEAIEDFNRAIELKPKYAEAYVGRGCAYSVMKGYEKGIWDISHAIELDPKYALAYYNRGGTYYAMKTYEKAIEDYNRAIELDSKYALAYNNRGVAYHAIGRYERAIEDFNRAIELDLKDALAYHNRGCAYRDMKQYEKAMEDFDRALAIKEMVATYVNKAVTLYWMGRLEEAKRFYRVAIQIDSRWEGKFEELKKEGNIIDPEVYATPLIGVSTPFGKVLGQKVRMGVKVPLIPEVYAASEELYALVATEEAVEIPPIPEEELPKELPGISFPPRKDAYGVVIGISDYTSKYIQDIKYAEKDAEAIYQLLVNPQVGGLPGENVKLILGEKATLSEMRKVLRWLGNQASTPESFAFFYYSGHGVPAQDEKGDFKEPYLVPYDCDPEFIEETALPVKTVKEEMDKMAARQVVVALDACFSGKGRSFLKPGSKGIAIVPTSLGLGEITGGKVLLTASKSNQISTDYDEAHHGLFTYYLLDGLKGKADDDGNKDGWVEANEVFNYVKDKVKATARKLNVTQEPEIIGTAKGLKITRNYELLALESKEAKIQKLKSAYRAGDINTEQLDRAIKEIEEGRESKELGDFLKGKMSAQTFGKVY